MHDRMTDFGKVLGKFEATKKLTRNLFRFEDKALEQELWGIKFENPLGLSAGFDKDAQLIDIMGEVGFSYQQVGSVTWKAYEGNPKPRLVRLPKSKGLVVYYGLKNDGVEEIIRRIKETRWSQGFKGTEKNEKNEVTKTNELTEKNEKNEMIKVDETNESNQISELNESRLKLSVSIAKTNCEETSSEEGGGLRIIISV